MELQKGQKCKLADLTGSGQLRISVTVSLPGSEADVTWLYSFCLLAYVSFARS